MERINITKEVVENALNDIRLHNHIERYQLIKRYCYGSVLDIACGQGYGTYLLSNNPAITDLTGVDSDVDTITHAVTEFDNDNIGWNNADISKYKRQHDTLVSLETIEHLKDLKVFRDMVKRVNPNILIVSFPNKKSTHFNPYHFQDLQRHDVNILFEDYILIRELDIKDVSILVMIKSPDENIPKDLFNNI